MYQCDSVKFEKDWLHTVEDLKTLTKSSNFNQENARKTFSHVLNMLEKHLATLDRNRCCKNCFEAIARFSRVIKCFIFEINSRQQICIEDIEWIITEEES